MRLKYIKLFILKILFIKIIFFSAANAVLGSPSKRLENALLRMAHERMIEDKFSSLLHKLFNILRSKEGLTFKLVQLIKYYIN